jgi:hypothetical protein
LNQGDPEFGRHDLSALELRIGQSVALAKGSMASVAAPRRATSSRRYGRLGVPFWRGERVGRASASRAI